ncbi:MAG: hypothetical protein V4663_17535, partial [Bacteroidota bacterium]
AMANAVNGCYVVGTARMYYQTPNGTNTLFEGAGFYVDINQCSNGGQYFGSLSSTNTNCWAVYDGSGSKNQSSNYLVSGKKATFTVLTCPIDDYILPFMMVLGGIGFFALRRRLMFSLA